MLRHIEDWRTARWTPEKIEAATRVWFKHLAR